MRMSTHFLRLYFALNQEYSYTTVNSAGQTGFNPEWVI